MHILYHGPLACRITGSLLQRSSIIIVLKYGIQSGLKRLLRIMSQVARNLRMKPSIGTIATPVACGDDFSVTIQYARKSPSPASVV